ncbi:alpha/beta hydrolase [Clostridium tarantellae]|uniref:Alpha/beta hydrolase fold domain-containing protein n=1 Tax=Clostridium tarantellae TaxID=39493 RepID=A0A6I1MHA4_9CLOT|nr:alpha/beta hydrolase [Clostridium tarantellae]MPQ42916.1 alpha/beta hydrolase fold domain-containing protein [Clostridium tarantellae]
MRLLRNIEENIIRIPIFVKTLIYNMLNNNKYEIIKYGEEKKQYYIIYEGNKKNKFIFFIHGGGWWHGTPKFCKGIANFFLSKGYNVIMPSYRLVPFNRYPTQIKDIFKAYKDFINNFNKENNDIIIVAYSAGCELAVNLILNNEMNENLKFDIKNIKKVVLLSGTLDFNKCTSKRYLKLIKNYIGKNKKIEKVNPINLIHKKIEIPFLCIHGERDSLIDINNSISFVNKLNNFGGKGILMKIKNKHHCDTPMLLMNNKNINTKNILNFIKN